MLRLFIPFPIEVALNFLCTTLGTENRKIFVESASLLRNGITFAAVDAIEREQVNFVRMLE